MLGLYIVPSCNELIFGLSSSINSLGFNLLSLLFVYNVEDWSTKQGQTLIEKFVAILNLDTKFYADTNIG